MCKRTISRRKFLGQASCAAVGSTAFLSTALNLGMINTVSARPHIVGNSADHKAIVCILLAGGCDTHNVLVPTGGSDVSGPYADYKATRGPSLTLDRDNPADLLPLKDVDYHVHAGMSLVQAMFDSKDLSFVSNIGTLIEPIQSIADYESGVKKLPLGLYSHSDQIMQWQTSIPQTRTAVGVGGRMADLLQDMNSIPEVSMNISLSGKNQFQAGNQYNEYSIKRNVTADNVGFDGFPEWWSNRGLMTDLRNTVINNMAEKQYANIFEKTIGSLTSQTQGSIEIMRTALANLVPLGTPFNPKNNLALDLKKIAELISVQNFLGANRQIFFVTYGGWDHHDNVIANQARMLPIVSEALSQFNASMKDIGKHEDVLTFTISDFARTLTSNGNGSDHGWGGNQIIMGGPIKGGEIFGTYPSLALNSDYNVSERGRMIPTTSVDEFYAEVALWFGASPNDLDYILPNLGNFYSGSGLPSNYSPIGMFA